MIAIQIQLEVTPVDGCWFAWRASSRKNKSWPTVLSDLTISSLSLVLILALLRKKLSISFLNPYFTPIAGAVHH